MAEQDLRFDLPALLSLHRFGDIYARAIRDIRSSRVEFEVLRDARDSIGPHWYGMRCRAVSKVSGISFYLHTGLIFLPSTQIGLMVEVDEKNNQSVYGQVVERLRDGEDFTVNREEREYLKLFMPRHTFEAMNRAGVQRQEQLLGRYMKACGEALAAVVDGSCFRLCQEDLLHAYGLGRAFRRVITETVSPDFTVEINEQDPDNFGQYASGYRCWLTNASGSAKLYSYFGAIYSYKKRPAGIFAEIDWFSNQEMFDAVKARFQGRDAFVYSGSDEKFIKLFMPQAAIEELNAAGYDRQIELLKEFFASCCGALSQASEEQ